MDKFSELIAKGVAAFEYKPVASSMPEQCPICRAYNNLFGAATDTHMSHLDDGRIVITGHIISSKEKFDQFLYASMWGGVQFRHSGYWSFSDFIFKNKLRGRYEVLNGDDVYILTPVEDESQAGNATNTSTAEMGAAIGMDCCAKTFVTSESIIPQNLRLLSRHYELMEVRECLNEDPYKTAQAMNESRNVFGDNWRVAETSKGPKVVGYFNNQVHII